MSRAKNLYCSCGYQTELNLAYICPRCLGPLSVGYNFKALDAEEFRQDLQRRPTSIWRYREFLPPVLRDSGYVRPSPLLRARGLEKRWGLRRVWIKNDTTLPTHSFKDRVVEVALQSARRLGLQRLGCASTGNLAGAVAAAAARSNMKAQIFVPDSIEPEKITAASVYGQEVVALPTDYDGVNYHCTLLAEQEDIGMVNINLRPYYSEGSKTILFEIAEDMSFSLPNHIVSPLASGSLLSKIWQGAQEWQDVGLLKGLPILHGGQDEGCAPIVEALQAGREIEPMQAGSVLAHSLAIGNPGSGEEALGALRQSGGQAEAVSPREIAAGVRLLAEEAGIWAESAGGVVAATAERLVNSGNIGSGESLVLLITGDGLKTPRTHCAEARAPKQAEKSPALLG